MISIKLDYFNCIIIVVELHKKKKGILNSSPLVLAACARLSRAPAQMYGY